MRSFISVWLRCRSSEGGGGACLGSPLIHKVVRSIYGQDTKSDCATDSPPPHPYQLHIILLGCPLIIVAIAYAPFISSLVNNTLTSWLGITTILLFLNRVHKYE